MFGILASLVSKVMSKGGTQTAIWILLAMSTLNYQSIEKMTREMIQVNNRSIETKKDIKFIQEKMVDIKVEHKELGEKVSKQGNRISVLETTTGYKK